VAMAAAPYLLNFLSSPNETLQEHAAFALGNLAGDGASCVDLLIANGIAAPITKLLESSRPAVAKTACFAMANLLRGHSPSNCAILARFDVFRHLFRHLSSQVCCLMDHIFVPSHLFSSQNCLQEPEVVSEAFWVLSYFTSTNDRYSQVLLQMGIAPILLAQLTALISHGPLALSLIRTLGNLLCGPDEVLVSFLQQPHFLPTLKSCLFSESK